MRIIKRSLYPFKYFQIFNGRQRYKPGKLYSIDFAFEHLSNKAGRPLKEAKKQSAKVWEIVGTDFMLVYNKRFAEEQEYENQETETPGCAELSGVH